MPSCSVIPELDYPDLDQAIAWLRAAFGFELRLLLGSHRGQLHVGNGAVVVKQTGSNAERPDAWCRVRALHHGARRRRGRTSRACAVQQGATILQMPTDYPYDERQYTCRYIAGHIWKCSQTIADVAPDEWGGVAYRLSD
jgi:uncharacterized glyoxalase superfamily protein PhnB